MTAEQLLERAATQLLFSEPFYGTLLLRTKRIACGDEITKYMAVDGKHLFYNAVNIMTLSFDVVKTILMHEMAHLAYGHHIRMIGKDPETSNIAADHVVNLILEQGKYTAWDGWLCDHKFEGQTFEQVYSTLNQPKPQPPGGGGGQGKPGKKGGNQPQQQPQPGQGPGKQQPAPSPPGGQGKPAPGQGQPQPGQPGQGQPQPAATTPGGMGQILPCPPEQKATQEQEWKLAVEQAATAAKAAGKLPGHLKRMVEEIREARVDWRELLRAFLANQIPTDFSWARPSKRTLSQNIYLPIQVKEGLGELVFSIDASGSIGKKELAEFLGEVNTVVQDLKPSKTWLVSHDTECYEMGEYGPGDEIALDKVKGGGGTDFRCVFDWVDESGVTPRAVVFLTDLYGRFPDHEPDYPVLWVSTSKQIAPFGDTVRLSA